MCIRDRDEIVAVNGEKIDDWEEILSLIGAGEGAETDITVMRDGREATFSTQPEYNEEAGRAMVGISARVSHNLFTAIGDGVKNTGEMTVMMYDIIKQLITGQVSTQELSGPVGIVYMVNDTARAGVIYVVYLSALLSLNLAVMNMLPFPALDGGRLLFLLIRKITGKKVTDEMEGKIHFIGIVLLMALMVYVTWNDIVRFIVPLFS